VDGNVWYNTFKEIDKSGSMEAKMIIPVNEQNIMDAANIHSISWKESHRDFCTPEFIEIHSLEQQLKYMRDKMNKGTKFFMLVDEDPVGVVSVTDSLIEDLYILPEKQKIGYGTKLLQFAVSQCPDTPSLWILENNVNAERLYCRMGFTKTGRINAITDKLAEIELALE
jgi:GNAT superfamily N-acetyltransferase